MHEQGRQTQRNALIDLYRHDAARYDRATRRFDSFRQEAIDALRLRPRDRVIDVGCGTGLNLAALVERVGPRGHVVGVDASPEMLRWAAARVATRGWANVTLVEARVEEADLGPPADAALFSLTHDVLQSDQALSNVVAQLRPGARVASFGAKTAAPWRFPVNAYVRWKSRQYDTDLGGLDAPWSNLAARLVEFEIVDRAFGGAYIAWGRCP
jgi:ubiquinone/menaquinone biosynthesis C-methylase UbiE